MSLILKDKYEIYLYQQGKKMNLSESDIKQCVCVYRMICNIDEQNKNSEVETN